MERKRITWWLNIRMPTLLFPSFLRTGWEEEEEGKKQGLLRVLQNEMLSTTRFYLPLLPTTVQQTRYFAMTFCNRSAFQFAKKKTTTEKEKLRCCKKKPEVQNLKRDKGGGRREEENNKSSAFFRELNSGKERTSDERRLTPGRNRESPEGNKYDDDV